MSRRRCGCCSTTTRDCCTTRNYGICNPPCAYNSGCSQGFGCGFPYNSMFGTNCFFNNPMLIWLLVLGRGRFFNC